MWNTLKNPTKAGENFFNACYKMGYLTRDFIVNLNFDTLEDYACEYKDFCTTYDKISDAEKGRQIGHLIGKYGIDVFAGGASVKGIKAIANLKNANKICTLEAMLASPQNKKAVIAAAALHAEQRSLFFKNVKIEWAKQCKHIPGKHNYVPGKSIFEHSNAAIVGE